MRRALVADDDKWILEINAETLRGMGFEVQARVSSGLVAENVIATWAASGYPFDLLVLDNEMPPGPTGLEILLGLRGAGNTTPVVLATGSDPFGNQSWPTHATLLQKPYSTSLLERVVRNLVPGLAS